jgi:hypothetical protein
MAALLNRKELFDRLANNVVDLYFTKVDGSKRRMKATLMSSVTGEAPIAPRYSEETDESGLFSVWDIDNAGWRSFRIERVSTVITPSLGDVQTDGTDRLN